MHWFCPNCWSEVQPTDRVCPVCGASLGECDQRTFEEKLLAALRHPEPATGVRVAGILGKLQSQRAVPELIQTLQRSRDAYLSEAAARALGEIGDPAAVPALRQVLRSSYLLARIAAAEALGKIGTQEAALALQDGCRDDSFRVREAVGKALAALPVACPEGDRDG